MYLKAGGISFMVLRAHTKSTVAIDIGSHEVKVIEGRQTPKGLEIDKYIYMPIAEGAYRDGYMLDDKEIYHFLNKALKQKNIETKETHVTIKTSAAITRTVILPDVDNRELEGILSNQIYDYIPTDLDKYVIQYKDVGIIDEQNVPKRKVLIIALPRDIIEMHLHMVDRLGLKPVMLDYQSNSIAKLVRYSKVLNNKYVVKDSTIVLLDLGCKSANITILFKGVIQLTRVLEYSEADMVGIDSDLLQVPDIFLTPQDSRKIFKSVIEKFMKVNVIEGMEELIRYYTSQNQGDDVDVILLYGGLSNIARVEEIFSEYFNIPTIILKDIVGVSMDSDMSKYLNCIGSLITTEEGK